MKEEQLSDVTELYHRTVVIPNGDMEAVSTALKLALAEEGFSISRNSRDGDSQHIAAVFGTKGRAFLYGLIPFYGWFHINSMRMIANLTVTPAGETAPTVEARIAPLMVLFDEEPIPPFGVASEYYLSAKLHGVLRQTFKALDMEIPPEADKFDVKRLRAGAWWRYMLYDLEPFASAQPILRVQGIRWSWGAFLLPEVWFLWNELWGPAGPYWILNYVLMRVYEDTEIANVPLWVWLLLLAVRIPAGLFGRKLYYMRNGRWR